MVKHKIEIFRRCFRCLYESLLAVLLLFFWMIIFMKKMPDLIAVIWVFVFFGASYLIREFSPNFFFIVLFHFIFAGISWLLPIAVPEKVFYLADMFFYLLPVSLSYIKKHSNLEFLNDIPWPSILTGFIIYLFGLGVHSRLLTEAAYIIIILMLMLYLLMLYVEGITRYINQTKDVADLPLRKILQTNTKIILTILAVLLIGFLIGRLVNLKWLFDALGKVLLDFFQFIVKGFIFIWQYISGLLSSIIGGDSESVVEAQNHYLNADYTTSTFLEALLKIFFVILVAFLIYRIGKRLLKILLTGKNYNQDLVERAEMKKEISEEKTGFAGKIKSRWTLEERLRRCYKKTIQNYSSELTLTEYLTCHDIEAMIEQETNGNISELTDIYTGVRYGNRTVNKALLKKMNDLSKRGNDKRQ